MEKIMDQESPKNLENSNLEDNLPMVQYIMLHRIYDLLTLISNKLVGPEDTSKMVEYHDKGYLLGPSPSFTPTETEAE
jgi:hypothetical protein